MVVYQENSFQWTIMNNVLFQYSSADRQQSAWGGWSACSILYSRAVVRSSHNAGSRLASGRADWKAPHAAAMPKKITAEDCNMSSHGDPLGIWYTPKFPWTKTFSNKKCKIVKPENVLSYYDEENSSNANSASSENAVA